MEHLSTAIDTSDHPEIGMMVGVSTGKEQIHDIDKLPLGAARYMLAADHARRGRNAEGVLFIGNKRDVNKKTEGPINRRISRLTALAGALIPDMKVMLESDLPPDVRARVEAQMLELGLDDQWFALEEHGDYKRWQTAVVGTTLLRNGYKKRIKYGMEALHDGEHRGERQFDRILPEQWDIECMYGPADRDVHGHWAVPYLLNTKNADARVCIPLRLNGIDAELGKIKPGIVHIALATWGTTADIVLGNEQPHVLHEPHLAADPLPPEHLQQVNDVRLVDDTKQKIEAALKKLVSVMS